MYVDIIKGATAIARFPEVSRVALRELSRDRRESAWDFAILTACLWVAYASGHADRPLWYVVPNLLLVALYLSSIACLLLNTLATHRLLAAIAANDKEEEEGGWL